MRHKPRNTGATLKPLLDIVMTTAGRFDLLEKSLDALVASQASFPYKINLIDNGSDSEERIKNSELFELDDVPFETKRFPQNLGFPQGANEGAKMGTASLIMFLSDDVVVKPDTLQKVFDAFADPQIGIVGIKLLFPEDSVRPDRPAGKIQHVGLCLNIKGEPIHPLIGWSKDHPKTCISRDAWAVTGACLTVRRELFEKVGKFDVDYGKGTYEDVTLCLRVRQLGFRIRLLADAIAYHHVGATMEKRKEPFPLGQNLQLFRTKFGNSGLLTWTEYEIW